MPFVARETVSDSRRDDESMLGIGIGEGPEHTPSACGGHPSQEGTTYLLPEMR